jgi:AraC-like DNA-binding protein
MRYAGAVTIGHVHYQVSAHLPGVEIVQVRDSTHLWQSVKDRFAYSLTISGRVAWQSRGQSWQLQPGMIACNQPGELHTETWRDSPGTFQVLAFPPALFEQALSEHVHRDGLANMPAVINAEHRFHSTMHKLHYVIHAGDKFAVQCSFADVTAAMIDILRQPSSDKRTTEEPVAIARAKSYLRDVATAKPCMLQMAKFAGLQQHYLSRVFSSQVGISPYQYALAIRIAKAKELLQTSISISETALRVGFCDQSQLHRHFVRATGVSPGRFARSMRPLRRAAV